MASTLLRVSKQSTPRLVLLLTLLPCLTRCQSSVQFTPSTYNPIMVEDQPIGSVVTTVGALYRDEFGIEHTDGTFSIVSGGDASLFTIETTADQPLALTSPGIVRTAVLFDRDPPGAQDSFEFHVQYTAPDGASGTVRVRVTLEDVNDNPPQFTETVFNVYVLEDTSGGSSISTITATDPDLSLSQVVIDEEAEDFGGLVYTVSNGRIIYSLVEGPDSGNFSIDGDTGVLSLAPATVLDVDIIDLYNLTVFAVDGGMLNDSATVLVHILDSNDNAPEILYPLGLNLTLVEDTPIGFVVLEGINATDADHGLNAAIQFYITDGDTTNSFTINEDSGEIVISSPLDREAGSIVELTVAARDQGIPQSLESTIHVVIQLLDVNDFAPVFAQSPYEATVSENSATNTTVVQIVASDYDEGVNGTVSYSIILGDTDTFAIDAQTGEIIALYPLDREEVAHYELVVQAVDNPENVSFQLSSVVNVTVLVGDANDNSPVFERALYEVEILDSVRRFEEIIQLNASDRDVGVNGQVSYRIVNAQDSDTFKIDENSGVVFVNRRFSHDASNPFFRYTVRALDNGMFRRTDDTELIINTHDVNENPPVFLQQSYNNTIFETTPVGEVVLLVNATDPDMGEIGKVKYRIVSEFDQAGSFEVNETTGEIYVSSSLDYDYRDHIFFQVEAYDGGFPEPWTDTANVTIFLKGENDEAPSIVFTNGFQPSVPENEAPPIDIVSLLNYTSDPDFGSGGEFVLSLHAIYDPFAQNDSFSFNETTGLLTSQRVFDREQQPEGVVVAINTTDFGQPQQSKVTNITILIEDKNDQKPYFETDTFATVYEFRAAGVVVVPEYLAMDNDTGKNAQLEYTIYAGDEYQQFTIDPNSSTIYTTKVLNKTEQKFYNLTIMALDQGAPQMHAFGQVFIEVLDANDQKPTFTQSLYNASVSEASNVSTFIFQVNATDQDVGTNAEIEYQLVPTNRTSGRFYINNSTGEIFTTITFDREQDLVFELAVQAVDKGRFPFPLTGETLVLIYVEDVNDNPPIFNRSTYMAEVVENSANGTYVISVLALDSDAESPNKAINYSLNGDRSDEFQIDTKTGEIFVSGEVDWEEGATFSIQAIATDLGEPPMVGVAEIMISVLDVNDVAPAFLADSLNLSIPENSPVDTQVGYINATDPDSPGNNSHVSYSILMDFSSGKFELDSETGLVTFVKGALNRESRPLYDLLVRATDHGSPQLHTDASLFITITDSNDFDPVFTEDVFTGSVMEDAVLGTSVLTIHATDSDIGSNAELRFSILDSSNSFTIEPTTGVVRTNMQLDFESVTRYIFAVQVSDSGFPARNDTAEVRIDILDSNDLQPVFAQAQYHATIRENLAPGTTVLRVFTSDNDTDTDNTLVEYSLRPSVHFDIHSETGVLYTTKYINREETAVFNLTITANNSAALTPLCDEAQVVIDITDLNDMHPTMDLVTEAIVPEDTSIGSVISTLMADDGDEGANGTIRYSIIHGGETIFILNSSNGEITLDQELDFEARSLYIFSVMAQDQGNESLTNFTNVLIQVSDSNDNSPSFVSETYTITVNSEVSIGHSIANLAAFDSDEGSNAALSYTITFNESPGLFDLDSPEGGSVALMVVSSLSSYAGQNFNLNVSASDPHHSTTAQVVIFIQGGSDPDLPYFMMQTFSVEIPENTGIGDEVFSFTSGRAVNADSFTIETGNDNGHFSMTPSGIVHLDSSVDFEEQSLYQLSISVANSVGNKSYTILDIEVTDINEHHPEFISDYFFVPLPETVPTGEPFFTFFAFDNDSSSSANRISYAIVSGDTSTFEINEDTGEISLRRNLDYESNDTQFSLTVSATNNAVSPHLSSEATVNVTVINGNNHIPYFSRHTYNFALDENTGNETNVGLNIVNVSAVDDDMGSQGEITYGMLGDHRYLDFRIDTFTGMIYINELLDYERQNLYTLEVIASDGGNPNQFDIAFVTVTLHDVNDNDPIWDQTLYSADLIENSTVGTVVIQVLATDADQVDQAEVNGEIIFYNRNGYVTYFIADGDSENHFHLDNDTGIVTVASALDRELYPEYNLTLNATDGPGRFALAYLHIVVHDVNDEIPVFSENPYRVGLPENTAIGTFVLQISANDTDLNSEVMYRIAAGNVNETFLLNSTNGIIWTNETIDREVIDSYTLVVEAIDMGPMSLTGTTEVHITVIDINEFPPVFSEETYIGEVEESAPFNTSILQLSASDMDVGENATVLFSIISGNHLGLFEIASVSGEVFVAGPIDFEEQREHQVVVMAIDSAPTPEVRLSSEVNVTIQVTDINDNSPQFVGEPPFVVVVREDELPEATIFNVSVTDADSGTNAEVRFSLNYQGRTEAERNFVIDTHRGVISLSDSAFLNLDRERTQSYDIIINVTDLGIPPRWSTASVHVEIADTNDNHPLFVAAYFNGSVLENLSTGAFVATVAATDQDIGLNAEISYEITAVVSSESDCLLHCAQTDVCVDVLDSGSHSSSNSTSPPFSIDSHTGVIFSSQEFDREDISSYAVVVLATDSSQNETQLSNSTCAFVSILDKNDETPTFSQSVYSANFSEFTGPGISVARVLATDQDISSNAEITYQLLSDTGSFSIHPITGVIITLGQYNREETDLYNVVVEATDRGDIPLSSTSIVSFTVIDENDNAPVFSQQQYSVSLAENLPPSSPVLIVNATDRDIGESAEISYALIESTPAAHFQIDSETGQIRTTQVLDREYIDTYFLTILATDHGNPPLNSTTEVTINVLDTNDLPPVFRNTPYSAQIEENYLPTGPILTVQADDGDLGTNSVITFTIVDISPSSVSFKLNASSGELYLESTLDAEFSLAYNLSVMADNTPATPEQSTVTTVTIEVLDKNDNQPRFTQLDYVIPISEASNLGYEVVQLTATDADSTSENSQLVFEITGGNDSSLFEINPSSGVIFVLSELDRETQTQHVLEVSVCDNGSPTLNDSTTVTVILQDFNDNDPVFEQSMYLFTVVENQPPLTHVGRVHANDIDVQVLSYYIAVNSSEGSLFQLNMTTGQLVSLFPYDRETEETYAFVAIATDSGQTIERTAEVAINITVLDVNDNAPEFTYSLYNTSWYENTTIGSLLLTVMALDSDVGRNGTLEYYLLPGNDSSMFSINSTSGEVVLVGELDRETQDLFQFTVVAEDHGIPHRLNGTAEVRITVLDNNDNTPVFNATGYQSILLEDSATGTVVLYTGASDADIDENAEIRFSLSEGFENTFAIDTESGVVTLVGSLDFEQIQNYHFFVIAQDSAQVPRNTSAPIVVEVVDLNDNSPEFDSEVYEVSIPENAILQSSIFQIPATDSDSTSNGELRYSITGGNLGAMFAVEESTGLISLDAYLDREVTDSYALSLRAVDLGSPPLTATAELKITVSDVNDHPPEFDSRSFSISIPESTDIGVVIFQAQASDSDSGHNSNLTYHIIGGNSDERFEIDPRSGEIKVTKLLDFEETSSYTLSVSVSDNGVPTALTDTMNLQISLSDVNEYPPVFTLNECFLNITENTVIGTPVGYFMAFDLDTGSQRQISYQLHLTNASAPFAVDELTGRLFVTMEPSPGEYQMSLEATDGQYITQLDIYIMVLPTTYVGPLFDPPAYYLELSEASEPVSFVDTLTTSLPTSTFSLVSMDTRVNVTFEVSSDGGIALIGQVDREMLPVYIFNVQVLTEAGDPVFAVVTVQVTDHNDFTPAFESSRYLVTISERTPVGTTILTISVSDRDQPGDNSHSEIAITSGNINGNFAFNALTGSLTVSQALDYEDRTYYVLTVNASNHLASPVLFSTAEIMINLMDENDNEPEFSRMFYQVQISESTPLGSTIIILEASDPDSGTNSELVFSISHLNVPYTFSINQSSGAIITNATFDPFDSYEISVMVVDRGNPVPRSDVTTVFVGVTPDNNYAPMFSEASGYSVEIPETLPVGSAVIQLSANDSDSTSQFPVTFSIVRGDPGSSFEVHPATGLIAVASSLDFLEQKLYSLTVEAEDFGVTSKSVAVLVNISIQDINNHDPQFSLDVYQVTILENITVGSFVLSVPATDPDASSLTYVMTENAYENGVPLFTVNSTTAEIFTTAPIDREFADSLEILISAIDSGYPVQRSRSVPVVVIVEDLNDTPPEFSQTNFTLSVLRFLGSGQSVGMVTAIDRDLIGPDLVYMITTDSSGGLFLVNSSSGEITTTSRIPEAGPEVYQVTFSAYDGTFTTDVALYMELTSEGKFCEDGFCTSILPVNCTFDIFPFIECNPHCYIDDYDFSPERQLCLSFSCLEPNQEPCTAIESCIPSNEACAGVCPGGMSVCPTTNICHPLSLNTSCDGSNVTCLINQTLVQDTRHDRYCEISASLPANGASCIGEGLVYCEARDLCSNLSAPNLCLACPPGLVECPSTGDCVPDLVQCCGVDEYFCTNLSMCLAATERCELPNVAPVMDRELVYLSSITSLGCDVPTCDDGHVVSFILSNTSYPALDSQGEEVSIAIIDASDVPVSYGMWQYATCNDAPMDSYGQCSNLSSPWITISNVSEGNALVLPNSARVRFVRQSIQLEGAVWLRVKLWDGNTDRYLSARSNLVRTTRPHIASTLPYMPNGAFSQNTTLLVSLVYPLILPPMFSSAASLQLTAIEEDIVFVDNRGDSMVDLVTSVDIPDLEVLPQDEIGGFPAAPTGTSYEFLLPAMIRDSYFEQVSIVNPTREERQLAQESGQLPGVAVGYSGNSSNGRWQVSHSGDIRQFVFLDSILSDDSQILLLNLTAMLRFVPHDNFCGESSILSHPWDGFWNSSLVEQLDGIYLITSSSSLSQYNLHAQELVHVSIQCIPDKPVLLQDRIQLDPIPYRLSYHYKRLLTSLVERDVESFRTNRERFSDYLQLVLIEDVTIRRLAPAKGNRTYVSFSVEGDSLSYEDVELLLMQRRDTLAELGFEVLQLSQDASYGPGAGCPGDEPKHYHGVQVNEFVSRFISDNDNDYLGLAVVGIDTHISHGSWQYHRGDWNSTDPFDPYSAIWVSFPSDITETSALLLHGNDRVRFVPRPDFFWTNVSSNPNIPPSIRAKAWDNSLYTLTQKPDNEISLLNVNTDPFTDTLQSFFTPLGVFSEAIVTIEAARYGCDGIINSAVVDDACCVCAGDRSSCSGCDEVTGSNIVFDACDNCGGEGVSCLGCDFIPFSSVTLGSCAQCVSDVSLPTGNSQKEDEYPPTSFVDCYGTCYGMALYDDCNVCSGGQSAHNYNSDMDCAGVCFGNATVDECGDCTGQGTNLVFNENMDCSGICGGPFVADSCGICQLPDEDGSVVENRDCAGDCFGDASLDTCGVCYGGSTGSLANSNLDVCGVCGGDNSTCIGCDGNVNSGKTIDNCGICGGNNCGCFQANSIVPVRGPRTGGTEVSINGAGFFLNDTATLGFTFDRDIENCGAPFRYPSTDETIPVTCLFQASAEQQLHTFSYAVDQGTIRCVTERTTAFETHIPQFTVRVRVADGPFSNPLTFHYDDYSGIDVTRLSPDNAEIKQGSTQIEFFGKNFINTSTVACLLYEFSKCLPSVSPVQSPINIPAIFQSDSHIFCILPEAEVPCRVTVRLTLDGQESGILDSSTIDFVFTYLFSAPGVKSAHFSNDLSSLLIQFDRQVELVDGNLPSCETIFREDTVMLLGGSNATCYWSNNNQDEITVTIPSSAAVRVNSPIIFKEGVILTRGELFSYATSPMTFVDPQTNAIQPVAVLNGPGSVPACGAATFTASFSQFPGYRGFEYYWSVFVLDSSIDSYVAILEYLDVLSIDSSSISLQADWFVEGMDYYLELLVVNSIGVQSDSVNLRLVKGVEPSLQVSVLGASERVISPEEDVLVETRVMLPDCAPSGQLEFSWQMFVVTDERRFLLSEIDLLGIRTQSPNVYIPAGLLAQNSTYILQLRASVEGNSETTTSLTIQVEPSTIAAVIHGGNRTVSVNRTLVLDARSFSLNPVLPNVAYVWSCNVVGSFEPCYNQSHTVPTPITIPQTDFVSFPANILASTQVYNFTLALTQGTDVSHASTTIEITSSEPPIVEILSLLSSPLSSHSLTLEGLVYSRLPIESTNWLSLNLPGQGFIDITQANVSNSQTSYPTSQDLSSILTLEEYVTIPLDASVEPGGVTRANLVLNSNVLIPGLTYSFELRAQNSRGSGFARISVTPDPPPDSSTLLVEPPSGIALETNFTISVLNAIDSTNDTPLRYQFGYSLSNESNITLWLSGIQTRNYLTTLLPRGQGIGDSVVTVIARIFDRKGGYMDVMVEVQLTTKEADEDFYSTAIEGISARLSNSRKWDHALASLSVIIADIEYNPDIALANSLKEEGMLVFLNVFHNYLPQTQTHYALASSLLSQLTANTILSTAVRMQAVEATTQMLQWFKDETGLQSLDVEVPFQLQGEPLYLTSSYRRVSSRPLSAGIAHNLLISLDNLLNASPNPLRDPSTALSFIQGAETLSSTLCQQIVLGEDSVVTASAQAEIYVKIAEPVGAFSIADSFVDFGTSVSDTYVSQACTEENLPCQETCFQGTRFTADVFANEGTGFLKLTTAAQEKISVEIEGTDPFSIELFSNVTSAAIFIPSQNGFLEVESLNAPIRVLIATYQPLTSNGSIPVCLYRSVGGNHGFTNTEWQLDTTTPPTKTKVDDREYYVCGYNHLSEFAVGLLPPPVITPPPVTTSSIPSLPTTSSSSPVPTSTPVVVTTEEPTIIAPTDASSGGGISPAAVAVPFILIILVAIVIIIVVVFVVWRKKKRRKMKISPGDAGPSQTVEGIKTGPLTPDEARIPMKFIQLQENGERAIVGTMNVLPSIRLRELRHELSDHFDAFKNKPFYFLTRQLCDIEPATEQQQFVSLVYGETPETAIFIRDITVSNEQTKLQFCTCGKAAQFECSNCNSQGYCSPECQVKHWNDQHQKECGRLSEKRRRSEVLFRRQSTVASQDQRPRRVTIATPADAHSAVSPTTPTDWKSFLSSNKAFQPPPINVRRSTSIANSLPQRTPPRTTLGQLAASQSRGTVPNAATSVQLDQRPLVRVPVSAEPHLSPRTQLPPLLRFPSGQGMAGVAASVPLTAFVRSPQALTSHDPTPSMLTPHSPATLNESFGRQPEGSYTPVQMPLSSNQPLFAPRDPRQMYTSVPYSRPLTVQSVDSMGLTMSQGTSQFLRDIRNEPLLESDEDDYESSSESETESQARTTPSTKTGDMRSPTSQIGSRPPSLAVRKKRGTSRMDSQTSTGSSTSYSGSETSSGDESEETSLSPQKRPEKSEVHSTNASKPPASPKPTGNVAGDDPSSRVPVEPSPGQVGKTDLVQPESTQ